MTRMGFVLATALAATVMVCSCGGSGKHLTGIQVYPVLPNISSDQQIQFSVVGFYSDGTLQTLNSSQGQWSSSDASIAKIDGSGLATSIGPQGSSTIAVTADSMTSSTVLSVAEPVLTIGFLGSGSGTVVSSPPGINCSSTCGVAFLPGIITLTATPTRLFGGWQGCDSTSGLTCTVDLVGSRTVLVAFD